MQRIVIISLAFGALTSCYVPQLDDCQFTCAISAECPSAQTCQAGMCRTAGATGACNAPVPHK